jgi:hypothetical protein
MIWYDQYVGMSLSDFVIGSMPLVLFSVGQDLTARIADRRERLNKSRSDMNVKSKPKGDAYRASGTR